MPISHRPHSNFCHVFWEGIRISDSNTLHQSGLSAPVFQGLLNETVADSMFPWIIFLDLRNYLKRYCVLILYLSFFWRKLQKGRDRFLIFIW